MKIGRIKIVTTPDLANAYTHTGTIHADEVFGAVILILSGMNIALFRCSSVPENISPNTIVFDIGRGEYDHHQDDGRKRENGTLYASCGLLWKDFYKLVLENFGCPENLKPEVFEDIDRHLIEGIDGIDNGMDSYNGKTNFSVMNIADIVDVFNPAWNEDTDSDKAFLDAINIATPIFTRTIEKSIAKLSAKVFVEQAIEKSSNRVIVLDKHMPWEETVLSSNNPKAKDALYIIYPSNRGDYSIRGIPDYVGSFNQRKPFPEEWRGLPTNALVELTGINGITFVHRTGFFAAASTLEDAIKIANKAVMA